HTGIAVGATAVLVPEVPFDIEKDVIRKIENTKTSDKKHFIIVVAEGVGHVDELAKEIEAKCGIESRATVLGHVQRGGSPTVRDRVIASKMGHEAVQLLKKGIGNRVVCLNKGDIVDKDIFEALNEKKSYEFDLHKVAHDISI
ncbi:MAG: 6-phosphofructokinase, partial [Clostridia bacterium]|nr:6-phosphofructokinase [Clostridia bacterium]